MNLRFILIPFIFLSVSLFAQETATFKIPKQKSIELGSVSVIANSFSATATVGECYWFDYAWQLRGFDGSKNAAFISVPIGYSMLHAAKPNSSTRILEYGWTVRHELRHQKRWIPWIGYALLLNNIRFTEKSGSLFGHQTRFELGVNRYGSSRFVPFIKVEYSYARFPQFDKSTSDSQQRIYVKIGVRF